MESSVQFIKIPQETRNIYRLKKLLGFCTRWKNLDSKFQAVEEWYEFVERKKLKKTAKCKSWVFFREYIGNDFFHVFKRTHRYALRNVVYLIPKSHVVLEILRELGSILRALAAENEFWQTPGVPKGSLHSLVVGCV